MRLAAGEQTSVRSECQCDGCIFQRLEGSTCAYAAVMKPRMLQSELNVSSHIRGTRHPGADYNERLNGAHLPRINSADLQENSFALLHAITNEPLAVKS